MSQLTQIKHPLVAFPPAGKVHEAESTVCRILRGIKNIFRNTQNKVPTVDSNFKASEADKGSAANALKLSGFRALGDRAKGVAAGITAKKDWSVADDKLLREPGHPFNKRALEWLSGQLELGRKSKCWLGVEKCFKLGLTELINNEKLVSQLDEISRRELDDIVKGSSDTELKDLTPQLKDAVFQEALKSDKKDGKVSTLYQIIRNEILEKEPVFNGKEYMELPEIKSGSKAVQKLISVAKDTGKISSFKNMIDQLDDETRKATRTQAAVRSYVNNLVEKLGIKTQKLDIRHFGGFKTGTAVLQSTQPENFIDFNEKEASTSGRPFRKDGVLVQHSRNENDPTVFDGPLKLCSGIEGLGRNKITLLLVGDQDPLKNKGVLTNGEKSQFFSNGSGSFLNENLLGKKVGVNSDFSLDSAAQRKNFSIHDQSTLAEKMEGVRQIQQLKKDGLDPKESMSSDIARAYINRREEILEVFRNRLEVDNFDFGPAGINAEDKKTARDQTLNMLDGLEKLTSTTVGTANGKNNGIRLEIPQVQKPEHRKAWNVRQSGNDIQFTFQGKSSEAEKILQTLKDFNEKRHAPSQAYSFRRGPEDFITVTVKTADIAQAQEALSYENIMKYKHSDLKHESLAPSMPLTAAEVKKENPPTALHAVLEEGSQSQKTAMKTVDDWLFKGQGKMQGFKESLLQGLRTTQNSQMKTGDDINKEMLLGSIDPALAKRKQAHDETLGQLGKMIKIVEFEIQADKQLKDLKALEKRVLDDKDSLPKNAFQSGNLSKNALQADKNLESVRKIFIGLEKKLAAERNGNLHDFTNLPHDLQITIQKNTLLNIVGGNNPESNELRTGLAADLSKD